MNNKLRKNDDDTPKKQTRKREPDPVNYPETGKRIIKAMEHGKIKNFASLAAETDHAAPTISNIVKGKTDLSPRIAEHIARACHVRPEYLLLKDDYMTEAAYLVSVFNEQSRKELSKLETNSTYSLFSLWGINVEPIYTNGLTNIASRSVVTNGSTYTHYEGKREISIQKTPDLYLIRQGNDLHVMTRDQWEEYLDLLKKVIKSITAHTLSLLSGSSESIKKQLDNEGIDLRPSGEILREIEEIRRQWEEKKKEDTNG